MIILDRLVRIIIGVASGILLMSILAISTVFFIAIGNKADVVDWLKEGDAQLTFIQNKINSVEANTTLQNKQEQLEILGNSLMLQTRYLEKLRKSLSYINQEIVDIFKMLLGAATITGFLLAVVNFHFKYMHHLKFFITKAEGSNSLRQRIVITNKKDRKETVLGAYLYGRDKEHIELHDLTSEPKSIDAFGHTTLFFDCEVKLEFENRSSYYKLFVVLGDGSTMKCSPIMQWRTAKGESLMALDRVRRVK